MSVRTLSLGSPPFRCALSDPASTNHGAFSLCSLYRRRGFRLSAGCIGVDGARESRHGRALCLSAKASDKPLDLPLLPFQPDEVMVPSEFKTLHLYEARFLALLEESLNKGRKQFVHFVLDPVPPSGSSTEASYAVRYGCLVFIENVEKLDIGALVSIRGIGRVSVVNVTQTEPYLRGIIAPIKDRVYRSNDDHTASLVEELKESLTQLNNLELKLKASGDEPLQTRIRSSLVWAENDTPGVYNQSFVPGKLERVSFAALQPVSGATKSEIMALRKRQLWAMTIRDTSKRLSYSLELVKHNIALVAAKLAIQSVEI